MSSRPRLTLLLSGTALAVALALACSAPPIGKNDLPLCDEGSTGCGSSAADTKKDPESSTVPTDPQHAPEPGAEPAPAPPAQKDAGPTPISRDAAPEPHDGSTEVGGCFSATLQDNEPAGACVQSASDGVWFQCHAGAWYRGGDAFSGPYGACTSSVPL